MRVDLNADVGESADSFPAAHDTALLRIVTSVNIACGMHAGNPFLIRTLLRLAAQHGVAAGAHPSLADRAGFGRRADGSSPAQIETLVLYQVAAVAGLASADRARLTHVKPHGALYHASSVDEAVADAVVQACAVVDRRLRIVGFSGSKLIAAARRAGLAATAEAFVDREYVADGTLVPRDRPGAVVVDVGKAVDRALRLVLEGRVLASDGRTWLDVSAETLCVHGDTPGAASLAAAVRAALEREGVLVAAPAAPAPSADAADV
jgi:UPF0271 protein